MTKTKAVREHITVTPSLRSPALLRDSGRLEAPVTRRSVLFNAIVIIYGVCLQFDSETARWLTALRPPSNRSWASGVPEMKPVRNKTENQIKNQTFPPEFCYGRWQHHVNALTSLSLWETECDSRAKFVRDVSKSVMWWKQRIMELFVFNVQQIWILSYKAARSNAIFISGVL